MNMKEIMDGNGHPDEGPCVVCGAVFDTHEPGCVFDLPAMWRQAALVVGEHMGGAGPEGYYAFTAEDWRDWAIKWLESRPAGTEGPGLREAHLEAIATAKITGVLIRAGLHLRHVDVNGLANDIVAALARVEGDKK